MAMQNYCYVITPNAHGFFQGFVRFNISALVVFLLIFYVVFLGKKHLGAMMEVYIINVTPCKQN